MAQTPLRGRGSKKCPHHFGYDVIYVCENCDNLACVQCVSKLHKGHDLETLSDVVLDIKQNIQDVIRTAEQDKIPLITEKLQAIDDNVSKTRQHCQRQISKVKGQNNRLKQKLDDVTEKLVKSYQDLEQESIDAQLEDSIELKRHLDDLNSRLQICRDTIQSGNDVLAFDVSRDKTLTLTDIQILSSVDDVPEFLPADISVQKLEHLVGILSLENVYREPKQRVRNEVSDQTNQPVLSIQDGHSNQQLGDWRVTSQFVPFKDIYVELMHASPENQAWIYSYMTDMLLTDHLGNVQASKCGHKRDFCTSHRDGSIWFCESYSKEVLKYQGKEASVQFEAPKIVESLCMTADNHIVLGHKNQLAKYTITGQVVCRTATGLFKSPVVREPRHITECPVTKNLAVIDYDYKGKDYPCVMILDKDLQLLYTYHGLTDGNRSAPFFFPQDLCYTGEGRLVVADYFSNAVMLVNGKGVYMETIYNDTSSKPRAVCMQSDGTLFIAFSDGSVRVLTNN